MRKRKSRFPSLEEVKEYAKNFDNLDFTPEYFYSYYEGSNWKTGHSRIRHWQSVFQVWAENSKRKQNALEQRRSLYGSRPSAADQQKILLGAETRMMNETERQMAEREKIHEQRQKEKVSYEEYQRMKKEGLI